jgi:hypothetical protein
MEASHEEELLKAFSFFDESNIQGMQIKVGTLLRLTSRR